MVSATPRPRPKTVCALIALLAAATIVPSGTVSADEAPPECIAEGPQKVDLLFAIDLTGSMGGELASVKAEASTMLGQLSSSLPSPRFGVASFMDYPGAFSYPGYSTTYGAPTDYPWSYDQALDADHTLADAAIQSLTLGSGSDGPESYSRVYLEAAELTDWRPDAHRILVVWGDAPPHDDDFAGNNFGLDPGRDATALTSDDIDFQTVVGQLAGAGVRTMAVNSGGSFAETYFRYVADETGGIYKTLSTADTLADEIEDFVDTILTNDTAPPTAAIDVPVAGHLYVNGVDMGATAVTDRALVVGDLDFAATAADACLLEEVHADVTPATGWSHSVTGLAISGTPYNPTMATFPSATLSPGMYTLDVRARDWVGLTGIDMVDLEIVRLGGQAMSIGTWAGANVPASLEHQSTGLDRRGAGGDTQYTAEVELPSLGIRAEGIQETVTRTQDADTATAQSRVEISELHLDGGAIRISGLVLDVTVSYDLVTLASTTTRKAHVASVTGALGEIVGDESTLQALSLETRFGKVQFFERESSSDAAAGFHKENIVHIYGAAPYGRGEAIIGSVLAQAGLGFDYAKQQRLILSQDDARSGGDAGDTAAGGVRITSGLYDGAMPPGDARDTYLVDLKHGEKINAVVQSALWANERGGSAYADETGNAIATTPTRQTGPFADRFSVELIDPDGITREDDLALTAGAPARLELNADKDGTWVLFVDRVDTPNAGKAGNYSLGLSVTPVPLLPQEADALSLADAPGACDPIDSSIPVILPGAWPGVVRDDDFWDVYRFDARIGELITVEVKPGETLDGVDLALWLWDRDCNVLSVSDSNGLIGLLKGAPEFVLELPSLYTGAYFVGIQRINGVGNHYTTLTVADPHPTAASDAGTGSDASDDPHATGYAAVPVFQGRIEEGDTGDGYLIAFEAGRETHLAVDTSALSSFSVTLTAPGGGTIAPSTAASGAFVWDFVPATTGDYELRISANFGGGGYSVASAQGTAPLV